ncbi:MAG: AzlC family ABC transporter permease [Ruminococcaceae bacterium]|nr:AzlC family ABC transporter permease [Oscillospiraceae bacterium]
MSKLWFFKKGVKDGIPIFLGYLAVSFTFGIAAKNAGISVGEAVLISATNVTSAGQFAALDIIANSASFIEMAVTQFIINLRYSLMSSALSQKISHKMPFWHRFIMSFGVTDEIFALSANVEGKLSPFYSYGMMSVAIPGWTLGTLLGVISGSLLPQRALSALSVALYGMFIAIVVPPTRKSKILAGIVIVSMLLSFAFTKLPFLRDISSGFRIIILTIVIAGVASLLFPIKETENRGETTV